MNNLKAYEKDGYKISATEKAYNLFYKKQGFMPVDNNEAEGFEQEQSDSSEAEGFEQEQSDSSGAEGFEQEQSDSSGAEGAGQEQADSSGTKMKIIQKTIDDWTVQELKDVLKDADIKFKSSASKNELYELLLHR